MCARLAAGCEIHHPTELKIQASPVPDADILFGSVLTDMLKSVNQLKKYTLSGLACLLVIVALVWIVSRFSSSEADKSPQLGAATPGEVWSMRCLLYTSPSPRDS